MGPDADDPASPRRMAGAHPATPGRTQEPARNQEFVAGIGNAYSDEILHAARLQPFRKRGTLAPEEVDELYAATRATLANAIAVLRERVPPTFETRSATSWRSTTAAGSRVPRCGHRITQTEAGGFVTSYCRHCQR
jgi:formamidopyrimidine-DNA glycosylase